jgi:hypothetical protein
MVERGRRRGLRVPASIEQPAIPDDSPELPSAYFLDSALAWLKDCGDSVERRKLKVKTPKPKTRSQTQFRFLCICYDTPIFKVKF